MRDFNATAAVGPSGVIALLVYNHADKLPETLASLEVQTRRDFVVLLLDDASTDDSARLCHEVAARDSRFHYLHDNTRRGYIENARRGWLEARTRFPHAAYFAWASDHDLYHPQWYERLTEALEAAPAATLAWPLCERIDANGTPIPRIAHRFETRGISSPVARFRETLAGSLTGRTVVGNMAYALFRTEALAGGPGIRYLLIPDRVLILEAALKGSCVQVPEVLWSRRYADIASLKRQKRASFSMWQPLYLVLPVWLTHVGHFALNWGVRGQGLPRVSRAQSLAAAAIYLIGYPRWHIVHRLRVRAPQWQRAATFAAVKPMRLVFHRSHKRAKGWMVALLRRLRVR